MYASSQSMHSYRLSFPHLSLFPLRWHTMLNLPNTWSAQFTPYPSSGSILLIIPLSSPSPFTFHNDLLQDVLNHHRNSGDLEEQRWAHYTEYVFYRDATTPIPILTNGIYWIESNPLTTFYSPSHDHQFSVENHSTFLDILEFSCHWYTVRCFH